jgi:2-methylcitrate dehydratase
MTIAENLAQYVHDLKYSDLSKDTIHQVKRHFLDALGCAIGAKNARPIKIIRKTFLNKDISINALLYGAQIRYFDFDDWYASKSREPAHPNDNFGGILAIAEAKKSSSKDFILASALGYELQCQLCDAANLRSQGWDHVIHGSISQALAIGKLMHLNKEQLAQTVNLNFSTNISSRQVRESTELSMWKAEAFSNVSRNAVIFAHLAKNEMKGPNEVFEGKYGMMNQLTGKFNLNVKSFAKRRKRFKILDCWLKNWPAEIHSQSVIQAALEMREKIKLNDIKSIHVDTHEAGFTIIGSGKEKWKPKTKETADHSIPYLVSAALVYGKIDDSVYSQTSLKNKKLLNLINNLTVKEDKKLTKLYPNAAANRLTITLKNGKKLVKEVKYHKGHRKNPMSDTEIEEKFHTLTKKYLSRPQRNRIIKSVWNMDKTNKFDWGILRKI